jgi:hypothetical protein
MSDDQIQPPKNLTAWQECKAIAQAAIPTRDEQTAALRKELLEIVASQGPEFAKLATLLENADGPIAVPEGLMSSEELKKGLHGISERIRKNPDSCAG